MKKAILSLLVLLFFVSSFMTANVTEGASSYVKRDKGIEKKADTESGLEDTTEDKGIDEDGDGFPAPEEVEKQARNLEELREMIV